MHKLILTFDYELFLGRDSGTVVDCMIHPTNKILDIFEKNKVRGAIFFVDTTCLIKLREYSEKFEAVKSDLDLVFEQIKQMVSLGHYVFPHLHPHWEDAIYNSQTNKWDLSNNRKYRFSNICEEQQNFIFEESIALLQSIVHPIYPDYKFDAYRAGGYTIQPFVDFKKYFHKHNIKYEFSVLKDFFEFGNEFARTFDFRNITHLNYYKFKDTVNVVDYTGDFVEFAISSFKLNVTEKFMNKLNLKIGDSVFHRYYFGQGVGAEFGEVIKTASNFQIACFEYCTFVKDYKMWKKFKEEEYLQTVSHPKMMSAYDLKMLDQFIIKAKKYCTDLIFDFKKIEVDKPNILICSYILPPQPGIGGRRWAKFAKYLTKLNYNLKLFTSQKAKFEKGISPWTEDIKGLSIRFLKRDYSVFLEKHLSFFIEKIIYRIMLYYYLIKHKGSIYDKAINWENQYEKTIKKLLIKENIYCSIATGAPFSLIYYNSKLKDSYPTLKVINDFRDPWTWGKIYGFENIDKKRLKYEESREKFVIQNSDYITSSAEFIHEVLCQKYSNYSYKINLIPHAFDNSEIQQKLGRKVNSGRIKIVFGGTLYENLNKNLRTVLDFIIKNKDKVEIDFYVSINNYENVFNEFKSENIRVSSQLNSTEFINKINEYDFYLAFANERIKDNISTKYYEVIASKLPFIYIGPKGMLTNTIEKYKLGLVFTNIQNDPNVLQEILTCNNSYWSFDSFPIEEYSFESVTRKLEALINQPMPSSNEQNIK